MAVKNHKSNPEPIAADILRLEYVPLDTAQRWERNAKKHDEGAIWQSIELHGFKDPPKFEPRLNKGKGGIVEGNGRSHVLKQMQIAGENPPRGVVVNSEGVWLVPILFGVDADSEKAAEAYGVDHNNITLLGGDFGPVEVARLWDQKAYTELMTELAQSDCLPISVDGSDVDALIESYRNGTGMPGDEQDGAKGDGTPPNLVPGTDRYKEQYAVTVICSSEEEQREIYDSLKAEGYECRVVST